MNFHMRYYMNPYTGVVTHKGYFKDNDDRCASMA